MVSQYPYQLWVLASTEATRNEQGHYTPGTNSWVMLGVCRDEVNSKGGVVQLEDGQAFTYETLLQMPRSVPVIYPGTQVEVRDGSQVRVSGTVVRSVADQFHKRAWV